MIFLYFCIRAYYGGYSINRQAMRQSGYQTYIIPTSKIESHAYSFFQNKMLLSIKFCSNLDTCKNAQKSTTFKQETTDMKVSASTWVLTEIISVNVSVSLFEEEGVCV